jgi:integrase
MASIRKRTWKSGGETKTAWIADYFDQAGIRHIKTFKQKKEADAWLVGTRREVQEGIHTPASASVTIAAAGEAWIAQGETDGLERSTLAQYRQHLDYHIKPFLAAVKLAELTPGMVRAFRNDLIRDKRSPTMAKKVVGSLGAILANAMADHKVARNVVREQAKHNQRRDRRIEKRHAKRLEVGVDIPTKEEIRAMLSQAQGRWRPLIVTATFTGLRASELRGLRWDDVDLDRAVLTVRQRADRWGTIGSPKSDAGKREVPLAPMVTNALREWRLACPKGEHDLVFPNTKGNVDSLPNMHRRGLGVLQVATGIAEPGVDRKGRAAISPKYGLHSLRHAAASLFIEQGFTPKRVQSLMGHSSIQVTFDTYGHLYPTKEEDQVAMQQLQARLVG